MILSLSNTTNNTFNKEKALQTQRFSHREVWIVSSSVYFLKKKSNSVSVPAIWSIFFLVIYSAWMLFDPQDLKVICSKELGHNFQHRSHQNSSSFHINSHSQTARPISRPKQKHILPMSLFKTCLPVNSIFIFIFILISCFYKLRKTPNDTVHCHLSISLEEWKLFLQ